MPLFSVIIPVYNVAEYIESSVRSICLQSFREFEVILVDDGSKDASIDIAERVLAEYDVHYTVIRKQNGGLSSARNTGTKAATGEWIICLDSDDCLHPKTLEIVSGLVGDSEIDVIAFDFIKVDKQEIDYPQINEELKIKKYCQAELANAFLLRELQLIVPSLVMRRSALNDWGLQYVENCRFSEDQLFIWYMIFKIEQLCFVEHKLYYYLIRPNSIMTSSSSEKIVTGFNAFKILDTETVNVKIPDVDLELILPRWVIGTLHTASRILSYQDFCSLANALEYKRYVPMLRRFPDKRISILASFLMVSKPLFYRVSRIL